MKTRQVTHSILKHLSEYVQNLEKVGLLEKKEMDHLDDIVQVAGAFNKFCSLVSYIIRPINFLTLRNMTFHLTLQTDLKKLLRNPPLVKMPKISDLLSAHPFWGALPSAVREPIEGSTKEVMKIRGVTLYKEGSKPIGMWLIPVGVVKVSFDTKVLINIIRPYDLALVSMR